jgi:eukaryotic-like serine/threonine-protein kinase
MLGAFTQAEAHLRRALADGAWLGASSEALANHNFGLVAALQGKVAEGAAAELAAIEAYRRIGDERMEGAAHTYLARILTLTGDLTAAEAEARRALDVLATTPLQLPHAHGVLAMVLLEAGRTGEALASAREGVRMLDALGSMDESESLLRLVHVEALERAGEVAAAEAALGTALTRLEEMSSTISDEALRRSFLENVPENARLLARRRA